MFGSREQKPLGAQTPATRIAKEAEVTEEKITQYQKAIAEGEETLRTGVRDGVVLSPNERADLEDSIAFWCRYLEKIKSKSKSEFKRTQFPSGIIGHIRDSRGNRRPVMRDRRGRTVVHQWHGIVN